MPKQPQKFYIKERHNPQLGVYYVRKGQMSRKDAYECTQAVYGHNNMLPFDTEEEYLAKIEELKAAGHNVSE